MKTDKICLFYAEHGTTEACLMRAASCYTGEDADTFVLHREAGQKPYFQSHPHLFFSVSHSGSLWACAFSDRSVGLDIQLKKPGIRFARLAERWFHPDEAASVATETDFYRIWSRKEAFVKAIGIGIDPRFRSFDARGDCVVLDGHVYCVCDLVLPNGTDDYSAALACTDPTEMTWKKLI